MQPVHKRFKIGTDPTSIPSQFPLSPLPFILRFSIAKQSLTGQFTMTSSQHVRNCESSLASLSQLIQKQHKIVMDLYIKLIISAFFRYTELNQSSGLRIEDIYFDRHYEPRLDFTYNVCSVKQKKYPFIDDLLTVKSFFFDKLLTQISEMELSPSLSRELQTFEACLLEQSQDWERNTSLLTPDDSTALDLSFVLDPPLVETVNRILSYCENYQNKHSEEALENKSFVHLRVADDSRTLKSGCTYRTRPRKPTDEILVDPLETRKEEAATVFNFLRSIKGRSVEHLGAITWITRSEAVDASTLNRLFDTFSISKIADHAVAFASLLLTDSIRHHFPLIAARSEPVFAFARFVGEVMTSTDRSPSSVFDSLPSVLPHLHSLNGSTVPMFCETILEILSKFDLTGDETRSVVGRNIDAIVTPTFHKSCSKFCASPNLSHPVWNTSSPWLLLFFSYLIKQEEIPLQFLSRLSHLIQSEILPKDQFDELLQTYQPISRSPSLHSLEHCLTTQPAPLEKKDMGLDASLFSFHPLIDVQPGIDRLGLPFDEFTSTLSNKKIVVHTEWVVNWFCQCVYHLETTLQRRPFLSQMDFFVDTSFLIGLIDPMTIDPRQSLSFEGALPSLVSMFQMAINMLELNCIPKEQIIAEDPAKFIEPFLKEALLLLNEQGLIRLALDPADLDAVHFSLTSGESSDYAPFPSLAQCVRYVWHVMAQFQKETNLEILSSDLQSCIIGVLSELVVHYQTITDTSIQQNWSDFKSHLDEIIKQDKRPSDSSFLTASPFKMGLDNLEAVLHPELNRCDHEALWATSSHSTDSDRSMSIAKPSVFVISALNSSLSSTNLDARSLLSDTSTLSLVSQPSSFFHVPSSSFNADPRRRQIVDILSWITLIRARRCMSDVSKDHTPIERRAIVHLSADSPSPTQQASLSSSEIFYSSDDVLEARLGLVLSQLQNSELDPITLEPSFIGDLFSLLDSSPTLSLPATLILLELVQKHIQIKAIVQCIHTQPQHSFFIENDEKMLIWAMVHMELMTSRWNTQPERELLRAFPWARFCSYRFETDHKFRISVSLLLNMIFYRIQQEGECYSIQYELTSYERVNSISEKFASLVTLPPKSTSQVQLRSFLQLYLIIRPEVMPNERLKGDDQDRMVTHLLQREDSFLPWHSDSILNSWCSTLRAISILFPKKNVGKHLIHCLVETSIHRVDINSLLPLLSEIFRQTHIIPLALLHPFLVRGSFERVWNEKINGAIDHDTRAFLSWLFKTRENSALFVYQYHPPPRLSRLLAVILKAVTENRDFTHTSLLNMYLFVMETYTFTSAFNSAQDSSLLLRSILQSTPPVQYLNPIRNDIVIRIVIASKLSLPPTFHSPHLVHFLSRRQYEHEKLEDLQLMVELMKPLTVNHKMTQSPYRLAMYLPFFMPPNEFQDVQTHWIHPTKLMKYLSSPTPSLVSATLRIFSISMDTFDVRDILNFIANNLFHWVMWAAENSTHLDDYDCACRILASLLIVICSQKSDSISIQ
ncbi:hypothetical protein BLNAU_11288 [Blattamonas nauphoetae]|uniref:Uncharacterized protein n=1 Tax=Blattamonas nauphoetae TaxID=2049346 RepID=A0ABQ9XNX5_9EUKA|nr:hypothetical protein BLNAU_11288 [Blattamonas nauphoetae]